MSGRGDPDRVSLGDSYIEVDSRQKLWNYGSPLRVCNDAAGCGMHPTDGNAVAAAARARERDDSARCPRPSGSTRAPWRAGRSRSVWSTSYERIDDIYHDNADCSRSRSSEHKHNHDDQQVIPDYEATQ